jgi:hypothetical protein
MISVETAGIAERQAARLGVSRRLRDIFTPLGRGVRRCRVAFADDNGPKGGVALRCSIQLHVARWSPIHVEACAASAGQALLEATDKLRRRVERVRIGGREAGRHPKKYFVAKRALVVGLLILSVLGLTTPVADAARSERHSGTVVSIDAERGLLVLGEIGPWRVVGGETVVTPRTLRLTPATEYRLYMRANVPGAYRGDFIEVVLDADDIAPGGFVTAECVLEGGRLVVVTLVLAELP